jgi:hypothetical protein
VTVMRHAPTILVLPAVTALTLLLGACANLSPPPPAVAPVAAAPPAAPRAADLASYLGTLAGMAPGDPMRQQATLDAALAAAQQDPSAANRLRYALALGSAGHALSNPIEAKRLIAELLAGDHGLQPLEVELAGALLREFDARVALYAELARQREDGERRLQAADAAAGERADALAAENARLRRALAAAERKLEAVAEMERSLLEQAEEPVDETRPPEP